MTWRRRADDRRVRKEGNEYTNEWTEFDKGYKGDWWEYTQLTSTQRRAGKDRSAVIGGVSKKAEQLSRWSDEALQNERKRHVSGERNWHQGCIARVGETIAQLSASITLNYCSPRSVATIARRICVRYLGKATTR